MKVLLILWAVGLTACEKLDRTYLPPPGSITAGGRPGDLEPPLEFPKENYPSTPEPTDVDSIRGGFPRPNFPNVAFGIDRQGPLVSSAEPFTSVVSVSKNTFKASPTSSYGYTQTTTLPTEGVSETIGPVSTQEYPTKTFSTDSNLDYPQQTDTDFISTYVPGSVEYGERDGQKISYNGPNFQINKQYGVQLPRKYKTSQATPYEDNFDSKSGATFPTEGSSYPDNYYDEERSDNSDPNKIDEVDSKNEQYPGIQENVDDKNKYQDAYSTINTLLPSKYAGKLSSPTSADISSFGYGSTPKYSPTIDDVSTKYDIRTHPERVQAETDRNAVIINYENVLTPEGFSYSYDTSNGIHADESGTAIDGVKAKGSYSYTGDDGKLYSIIYTADENGFLPRGEHLPTAPPIPDAILKVIEQAEINKQLGIIDDGSYDDAKYGHERYQGPMTRKPQFSNIIKQSVKIGDKLNSRQKENGSTNMEKDLNQVYIGNENGRPYSENSYSSEYDNQVLPDNDQINNNDDQVQDLNNSVVRGMLEQTTDDSESDERKSATFHPYYSQQTDEKLFEMANKNKQNNLRPAQNSGEFPHTTQVTFVRKGYGQDINQPSHTGYEYNQPQNVFNDNDENNLKSRLLETAKEQNDETEPEDIVNNEGRTIKPFITPNVSFNFNSRKTDDAMVKQPNINRPMTTSEDRAIYTQNGYNYVQPGTSTYNNNASDNAVNENIGVTEREFGTSEPYEPTSSSLQDYQAPYTSKVVENGRQRYNYPTPTLRSQYDSTTPLPSEMSSRLTPPSNRRVYYSPTKYTTASRPSITSETYRPTSRRPSYTGRINGVRLPTTSQEGSVSRDGYRGDSGRINDDRDKRPGQTGSQSDLKHTFGSSSRPNFGSQSSTEKVIGEDFSGPKQSQRFDPDRGYYY